MARVEIYTQGDGFSQAESGEVPAARINEAAIRRQAQQAIAANITYLAIGSPSAAQTTAQVRLLTRECTAVIRLLLNQLDDTAGT